MNHFNVKQIKLLGHCANVARAGSPKFPSLVFLMGQLQDIAGVSKVTDFLSDYYDLHILELPGTGNTDPLVPGYSYKYIADCLKSYVDMSELSGFHLYGTSYATGIVLEYAKKYGQSLASAVISCAASFIPERGVQPTIDMMHYCLRDPKSFARIYLEELSIDNDKVIRQKVIKRAAARHASKHSDKQMQCFIYNATRILAYRAEDLHLIQVPTLIIAGEFDPFITPKQCIDLVDAIPGSSYHCLANTDHLMQLQNPKGLAELIVSFSRESHLLAA
ncbi:MAG: hypothetical protein COA42_04690 [Alteromonadaceae bacterium]|nr:MAG: hypothetical protein COA42_04690 [Alteromonadaceae bacterium]